MKSRPAEPPSRLADYQSARTEWEERHGDLKKRLTNSHRITSALFLVLIAQVVAIVTLISQRNPPPYIGVFDGNMKLITLGRVVHGTQDLSFAIKRELIETWVKEARTVTGDAELQKAYVLDVMAKTRSSAKVAMKAWYADYRPDQKALKGNTSVTIEYTLPQSAQTLEVRWTETTVEKSSGQYSQRHFVGLFSYLIAPPKTVSSTSTNPIGFYVTEVNWSENHQ